MSPIDWLEMWYEALRSPYGIAIATDDIDRARAKLYEARRLADDPELDALAVTISPTVTSQLWIIHKEIKSAEAE